MSASISGKTHFYALVGHPIEHVKTPELYNAQFVDLGIDVVVVPIDVEPKDLPQFVRFARIWQNLVGIGVTIPHKVAMVDLVDELTTSARLCGATNVVRRSKAGKLTGTQMDGPGFVVNLEGPLREGLIKRALLVGAGGTAKAIAFELAAAGVSQLVLTNRTIDRAHALAKGVRAAFLNCRVEVTSSPEGVFDLITNATSVGMKEHDPIPISPHLLVPSAIVADVIMSPARTRLLHEAESRGCTIYPGNQMLEAQFGVTLDFLGLGATGMIATSQEPTNHE